VSILAFPVSQDTSSSHELIELDQALMTAALAPNPFVLTEMPSKANFDAYINAQTAGTIKEGQPITYASPLGRAVHATVVSDGAGALSSLLITDYREPVTYNVSDVSGTLLTNTAATLAFAENTVVIHYDDVDDLSHTSYFVSSIGGLTEGSYVGGSIVTTTVTGGATAPAGTFN